MSTRDSRSYESPESSDSENEKYAYALPFPLEYEVPDELSDVPPEIPEREPIERIPLQNRHPEESSTNRHMAPDLYTTLTHKHIPSIYSTPSHSTEFRANTAVTDSAFDITHLQSTTTINEGPLKSHSRIKIMVLLFLVLAILIGMVSLVVSLVAVFVTREVGGGDGSVVTMEEMAALQEEVMALQTTIAMMTNQTSGSVNLTSFYESCEAETKTRRCDTEQGYNVEFSCMTGSLPMEKVVISYCHYIMTYIERCFHSPGIYDTRPILLCNRRAW